MSFTDTLENNVLTWAFTNAAAPTRPTAWWVALFTTAPSDAGGGTEVTGGSYARQQVTTFSVSGTNPTTATTTVNLEWPTATGSWGTITHVAIMSASSGGTMYAYATLSASKTIASGDVFRIPSGDLDITLA